jgi:hypothetical protein
MKALLIVGIFTQLCACAASGEYQCPEPIGLIIRDDCDTYRTRYEATRVNVSAGFSKLKLEGSFADESLRNPSELIQVMGARMTALCHDFNACRLTPSDYQRRREDIDKTMTAIMALSQQLRRPDLKPEERRRLLEKLMRMLGEPVSNPKETGAAPSPAAEKPARKTAFFSSDPWLGSTMLPPMPPPVKAGFPRLVPKWGRGTLDHVWVPKSPDKPHHQKLGGYAPRARATLWGHLEADDRLEIRYHDGRKYTCPVRKNADGVNTIYCKAPKEFLLADPHYSYEVRYYKAADDAWATLGKIQREVVRGKEGGYRIDYDSRTREGWLYFIPEPRHTPANFERPHLYATVRLRDYHKATARCYAGGQAVTGALRTGRGSGQTGTFQDRDRYEQIKPGSSRAVKHPFIEWWHYEIPLPFVVPRASGTPPEGMQLWPPKTGDWRCVIKVDNRPVREITFTVKKDGKLEPLEGQQGNPGDLLHPWWKVKTRVIPNKVEAVREDAGAGV